MLHTSWFSIQLDLKDDFSCWSQVQLCEVCVVYACVKGVVCACVKGVVCTCEKSAYEGGSKVGHKENEGGPTLVIFSRCYILAYQLRFVM